MHAATIQNSPRLSRLLFALLDGQEHSTLELAQTTFNCAVSTSIGELRRNGINIRRRQEGRINYYRME